MLQRIEIRLKPEQNDFAGLGIAGKIKNFLGLEIEKARIVKVFTIDGLAGAECALVVEKALLHDPILQEAALKPWEFGADWVLEVGFKPGVTDNEGRTARETIALALGRGKKQAPQVYTATQFHFFCKLAHKDIERIAKDMLANELIQRFEIKSGEEWRKAPGFTPKAAQVLGKANDDVNVIPLSRMDDAALMEFSRQNTLALTLEEMRIIKDHYANPAVREARLKVKLEVDPTDAEIEVLAQTWSEHCKHKIFAAHIDYEDAESGQSEAISSLYKTCIQGSTKKLREQMGEKDFCRSVFKDNAGVVAFNKDYDLCIKVETHNSPSALDPYGGALTGIVGVNRDPMGTGLGANMVCNTDVFCFASPFHEGELPPRLLHPRRVMEGVREGVEHGGNKSGIPTVNGSVVFDERFLGKPLVFCGTVGLIPRTVAGRPGHTKKALPQDRIVMAGGRIGKDGIHGATFSSEELHEGSPATAVQIGDPITQRKLYDFIMTARDRGLYNAITDNGAGGLSSSVGEMAEDSGGCKLDLSKAPLKYDGLRPWEILLSEAQERMTLAVPPAKLAEFMQLAEEMDVEAADLGEFTETGYFHVCYGEKTVAWLPMQFMHEGLPQMRLKARWERPNTPGKPGGAKSFDLPAEEQGAFLKKMLGSLNICSKEYMIRQYDHEIKGSSVIKPLVGIKQDGPGDAAVLRPVLESEEGMALSHGICPKFSDYDTYWMMANAIDEAVRNAVAVGADPARLAGVDNFCWCDPVRSDRTPDGEYKLAQLVRANKALYDFCMAYALPCVSGKDSMKNDYTGGGVKISIPPTVLFSVLGYQPDIKKSVTTDFKQAGDKIYLLGLTAKELGGSEAMRELKLAGKLAPEALQAPKVDAASAKKRYEALFTAIHSGLVTACHDLSDGGLAVALAEMALGGRLGADVDIANAQQAEALTPAELLYSESASRLLVSVKPENAARFEALFKGQSFALLGQVTEQPRLVLRSGGNQLVAEDVEGLAKAFKGTLNW